MKIIQKIIFAGLTIVLLSCDGGLQPDDNPGSITPGFDAVIKFEGEWPSDVFLTYVVLFKDPLLSALDFNAFNLKYVSEIIPHGTKEFRFSSEQALFGMVQPGEYAYLAVAQSTSETLNLVRSAWRVAGIYKDENGLPEGQISIPDNERLAIEIICDFNNPPNQPPGE